MRARSEVTQIEKHMGRSVSDLIAHASPSELIAHVTTAGNCGYLTEVLGRWLPLKFASQRQPADRRWETISQRLETMLQNARYSQAEPANAALAFPKMPRITHALTASRDA